MNPTSPDITTRIAVKSITETEKTIAEQVSDRLLNVQTHTYTVVWEIDLEASCPQKAAEAALALHRDPHSNSTYFTVTDEDGHETDVDLE